MGRTITAVIVGYGTMFMLVFVSFSAATCCWGRTGPSYPGRTK